MTFQRWGVWLTLWLTACGVTYPEGRIACEDSAACPRDWVCEARNTTQRLCYTHAADTDSGERDAASDAASDAAIDANVVADASADGASDATLDACATDCVPTTIGLTLSTGVLSPGFDRDTFAYTVDVPLVTQTISITPSAPTGATITINGDAVLPGDAWPSPTLDLGDNAITVVTNVPNQSRRTYVITVRRNGGQQSYLKASNTEAQDGFGYALAISGDTLVVGAFRESSNGDPSNNSIGASGAAYVFVRNGNTWLQQAYLKASNPGPLDRFGVAVAISGDTIVVGSYTEDSNSTVIDSGQNDNTGMDSGAAYVFVRNGNTWSQQAYLKASNAGATDWFGYSVAVSGDTIVVGAHSEDSNATGAHSALGVSVDNDTATNSGAVYVFTRSQDSWTQQAYLKASNTEAYDWFGYSVAVSGDMVVVGANGESSNSTGVNADQSDNSATNSGAAYIFTRAADTWIQDAYLKPANSRASYRFGVSVAVDAQTVVVGSGGESSGATGVNGDATDTTAGGSGAAYIFTRAADAWIQDAYLKASNTGDNDRFGVSVAVSGDIVLVGASSEDSNASGINGDALDNSAIDSGAAYVFAREGSTWSQRAYLKASNTDAADNFGLAVAVSGNTLAVGAYQESSNATGINGPQSDNTTSNAGAAYLFR